MKPMMTMIEELLVSMQQSSFSWCNDCLLGDMSVVILGLRMVLSVLSPNIFGFDLGHNGELMKILIAGKILC